MPRYTAEQIYGFCRMAGFSPDESATFTAIALAESGGNSRSHNPVGEDSKGLWQINARAHPGLDAKYDLYDPQQNAKAAFEVSNGGSDASPWTVTHGSSNARYLRYKVEAQAAAVAYGDGPGHGVWTGTPGYGHSLDAGSDEGAGAGVHPIDVNAPAGGQTHTALDQFLDVAQAQVGDKYVFGAEVQNLDNPNPDAFDCSELTQWAAHQSGVTIPDGAAGQYRYFQKMGLLIPVEEAKHTPGALLFHFASDPAGGKGEPSVAHVAISTGDGKTTIEAKNSRAGVVNGEVGSNRFNYAAVIPGISDGHPTVLSTTPGTALPAEVEAPISLGGLDSDHDGLTDALERRMGLDPFRSDTDGDNLADGNELVTSLTNPRRGDTDGDGLADAFELARGLNPLSPDTDGDGHLDGSFGANATDSDLDGLDDALEMSLGLNPQLADSDNDGFGDALELHSGANALDNQANPLKALAAARQADVDPDDAGGLDDDHAPVVH